MAKEIERKFLIDKLPEDIPLLDVNRITQTYLATGNEEVRIRQVDTLPPTEPTCYLTLKTGTGLVREETGVGISKETYEKLLKQAKSVSITKVRGITNFNGLTIEVDIFKKPPNLNLAEIEFETETDANQVVLPLWLNTEVTGGSEYKNQTL